MQQAKRGARAESPDQQDDSSRNVSIPQFLQPVPQRQDSPEAATLHPQESPEETRGGHPEVADGGGDFADEPPVTMAAGPSPVSTGSTALKPLVTASQMTAAKGIVQTVLMAATAIVNKKTRVMPEDDRWLMDREELDDIGTPFARILARKSPIPGSGEEISDLGDLLEGVVGLLAYGMKQLLAERPSGSQYVPQHQGDEPPAPAGPGAVLSPLDPAYRVG
jgi:hypothetical protein